MTTRIDTHGLPTHAPTAGARLARIWRSLRMANALGRQRIALDKLDDHLLDDIGVTRDAARQEALRPVWDVPATWLK